MKRLNRYQIASVVGTAALLAAGAASATEPTYTSAFAPLLETINMTTITADVASFAGMALALGVVITGIAFVRGLLRKSTAG